MIIAYIALFLFTLIGFIVLAVMLDGLTGRMGYRKDEIEALEKKVKELEEINQLKEDHPNFLYSYKTEYTGNPYSFPISFHTNKITLQEAIKAIADHLKLELTISPEETIPKKIVAVKVKKETK